MCIVHLLTPHVTFARVAALFLMLRVLCLGFVFFAPCNKLTAAVAAGGGGGMPGMGGMGGMGGSAGGQPDTGDMQVQRHTIFRGTVRQTLAQTSEIAAAVLVSSLILEINFCQS